MKTLLVILLLIGFSFQGQGCGSAGPEFMSLKDYQDGKWTPGWWRDGMSADDVKNYIDGLNDSKAKELAVKFFEEKYLIPATTLSKDSEVAFGTVAISNELNQNALIGADLVGADPSSAIGHYSWYVRGKTTIYEVLPPGEYYKWFSWRGEKKFSQTILRVGIETSWHLDRNVSGVIVVTQP